MLNQTFGLYLRNELKPLIYFIETVIYLTNNKCTIIWFLDSCQTHIFSIKISFSLV